VAQLSDEQRAQVAELAGDRAPSAAVVALPEAAEASRVACPHPFAGLARAPEWDDRPEPADGRTGTPWCSSWDCGRVRPVERRSAPGRGRG
jgi:hypothetical protein